jgi:hypothetical protein
MDELNDSFDNYSFNYDFNESIQSANTYFSFILLGIVGNIICLLGLFGNILSIIVLSKRTMWKLSTYTYLLSLSICDAVGLVFTIPVLLQYTIEPGRSTPQWMTYTFQVVLLYFYPVVVTTQTLSVWITLVFTVDRYLYVCKPYLGKASCVLQERISF